MRRTLKLILVLALVLLVWPVDKSRAAIQSVQITDSPASVAAFNKYEVSFSINGLDDINPYNPNINQLSSDYWNKKGIKVDALITSPQGEAIVYPCFYFEGDPSSNTSWKGWKLRFTPTTSGKWTYKIKAQHSSGDSYSEEKTFSVEDGSSKGFVKLASNTPFFEFSDGSPYHPLGFGTTGTDGLTGSWNSQMSSMFTKMKSNGANATRVWLASSQSFEAPDDYGLNSLNKYRQDTSDNIDQMIKSAEDNGIFVQFMLDDWTRFKGGLSPYIKDSASKAGDISPVTKYEDVFNGINGTREIYMRKLRYAAARWGYSTNILAWEFINEYYGSDFAGARDWHRIMGAYLKNDWSGNLEAGGTIASQRPKWDNSTLQTQPHLFTSSNGNLRLRTNAGIPWTDSKIDIINYHNYYGPIMDELCTSSTSDDVYEGPRWNWSGLDTGTAGFGFDTFGSILATPWHDSSVLIDRTASVLRKDLKWNKPMIIGEYGFEQKGLNHKNSDGSCSSSKIYDWTNGYKADLQGRHMKDAIWPGIFTGIYSLHWKAGYMMGTWPSGAEDRTWIFKPVANYLKGEDFRGLQMETSYPGETGSKVESINPNIMATGIFSQDRSYLYIKNLTDSWYRAFDSTQVANPSDQSGLVKVKGLTPSTEYKVEKWSTTASDQSAQILETKEYTSDGSGVIGLNVVLGHTMGSYDYAYKVYSGVATPTEKISIVSTADKPTAVAGDTINISNAINNPTTNAASGLTVTNFIPYRTSLVSTSDSGVAGTKDMSCDQAAAYAWPACSGTFKVNIVTWSGINIEANSSKTLSLVVKVDGPPVVEDKTPPIGTVKINVDAASVTSPNVILNLSATDSNSEVSAMHFSNDNIHWSDWVAYAATSAWDLTSAAFGGNTNAGTKTVYVQFKDPSGNTSATASDSIAYSISAAADYIPLTGSNTTTIEAEDSRGQTSDKMEIGQDNIADGGKYISVPDSSDNSNRGATTFQVDASNAQGAYQLWARYYSINGAGNSFSVSVDEGTAYTIGNDNLYGLWHWVNLSNTLSLTGKHSLNLISREDGTRLDKVVLTMDSGYEPGIMLFGANPIMAELEDPASVTLTGNMTIASDGNASNGKFVWVPDGKGNDSGMAALTVDTKNNPGRYTIWLRAYWPDTRSNSLYAKIDNGSNITVTDYLYKKWHWVKMGSTTLDGKRTLTLTAREDGSKYDKVLFTTNSSYIPR